MKKLLFVLPVAVLLAAGCNSTQQAQAPAPIPAGQNSGQSADQYPTPTPTPSQMETTTPTPTSGVMTTPSPTPTPSTPVKATIALKLETDPTLGKYLAASNGMTLYSSSGDTANTSNCTGSCAANWPPYTVSAALQLGAVSGIGGTLGTITRADGTAQLTYKGMPLYFWSHDSKPGDITGQGIGGFSVATP